MPLLRISELAERSGVPPSTLRYYERIGLVQPSGRADNGYRVYDDESVERLAFIGRAKRLGMSLDDVATLVEAWFAGECEPLQARLRASVTARLGAVRRQIAEESAFACRLERIAARLANGGPLPGRCGPDCGCDTDPHEATGPDGEPSPTVCSLGREAATQRIVEWQQLLGSAQTTQRDRNHLRVTFASVPELIVEMARLCGAETSCCPFFGFTLDISTTTVTLAISWPPGVPDDLINQVFDSPETGAAWPEPTPARG